VVAALIRLDPRRCGVLYAMLVDKARYHTLRNRCRLDEPSDFPGDDLRPNRRDASGAEVMTFSSTEVGHG
jgi:hypothetical protein